MRMSEQNMARPSVNAQSFVAIVQERIGWVSDTQAEPVARAAQLVLRAVRAGGVIHAFGSGHSQALAMEISGRAGGLIPTNMISLRDVLLYGERTPQQVRNDKLERDPAIAQEIFDLAPIGPDDVMVIASNSGINGSIVEFARIVAARGLPIIAITSLAHSEAVESRHRSGRKLKDLATVVIDNGAPFGDAVLPLPGGGAACGVSSITAALIAQMIVAEVLRQQIADGDELLVYLSANMPQGDAHNSELESRYAGRIRRSA
jgi:uncharacterized phosphosugar-binding protein